MLDPNLLQGPIPGMSLITEPGNRPWENPAMLTTVGETIDFYTEKLLKGTFKNALLAEDIGWTTRSRIKTEKPTDKEGKECQNQFGDTLVTIQ